MLELIKKIVFKLLIISLIKARNEQGYKVLVSKIKKIIPNLKDQYTSFVIEGNYLETKVYNQHAFQIQLILDAIKYLSSKKKIPVIVDIGDSSGNHIIYLKSMIKNIDAYSVNIDPIAIKKIKNKGLKAIELNAETLYKHPEFNKDIDLFVSLQMLEHLKNPIGFLSNIGKENENSKFVISVPWVNKSRIGLHQLRNWGNNDPFNAETTHIFELSPDDWDLLFMFSGWKVVKRVKYAQYPRKSVFYLMKYIWRKIDFDGFYGVILEKNDKYSSKYNQ